MPKIVRFHEVGDASVLKLEELPKPQPGEGEALLKVEAIGLNRAEIRFRSGAYGKKPICPSLIGDEASGIIESVGPGVTDLKPGDRVSSIPAFSMTKYGTYGEYAVLPIYALAPYPEHLIAGRRYLDLDAVYHGLRCDRVRRPKERATLIDYGCCQ